MIERIRGKIQLLTQLVHHGDEKTGSTPVFRTITIWCPEENKHVRVPFVSGNAIRGMLRRLIFKDLVSLVGYEKDVTPKLHHALFSGGVLESSEGDVGELDMAFKKLVRETIPPLALFGTAIVNQMIPSTMIVEHAFPVAKETRHMVASGDSLVTMDDERLKYTVRTFIDNDFHTRRDELREKREEDEQAVQMKVELEVLIPGTLLMHGFCMRCPNSLELSAFGRVIDLWAQEPFLAGKSSSGHGKVAFEYQPKPSADEYLRYVKKEAKTIRNTLDLLRKRLKETK